MLRHSLLIRAILFLAATELALVAQPNASPVLDAMKTEIARSQEKLKGQPVPPYFISYQISETHGVSVSSAFGKTTNSNESRTRMLDVDVRVGDYNLDNTREVRGESSFIGMQFSATPIPLDNDPDAVRAVLWIGIGAAVTRRPLPHHRAYGSVHGGSSRLR